MRIRNPGHPKGVHNRDGHPATLLRRDASYARSRVKAERVLAFLDSERFTTREVIGELLGITPSKAHMLLTAMEAKGLVGGETVNIIGGRKTVWFTGKWRADKLGGLQYLQHRIDTQLMHASSINAGWTGWTYPKRTKPAEYGDTYPDAEVYDPNGLLVAVEIERTPKDDYTKTVIRRLLRWENTDWDRCIFMSPTPEVAVQVRRGIDAVAGAHFKLGGQKSKPDSTDLRTLFIVRTYKTAWVTPAVTPAVTNSPAVSEIVSAVQ